MLKEHVRLHVCRYTPVNLGGVTVISYYYLENLTIQLNTATDTPLSIKLIWRCCIELMHCSVYALNVGGRNQVKLPDIINNTITPITFPAATSRSKNL